MSPLRWSVWVDGVRVERCRTRARARETAAWWRREPSVKDRRLHHPGWGVVEVRDALAPVDQ